MSLGALERMLPALERILPTLLTAIGALAAMWLAMWALTRWLRRWAPQRPVAIAIQRLLQVVALVVVALIVIRGLGLGEPRLTWNAVNDWILAHGLRILFILVGGYVLARIADAFIAELLVVMEIRHAGGSAAAGTIADERRKRVDTVGRLLRGAASIIIGLVALLMALRELNVDIAPILTGAGVVGVSLGLAGQSLMRDLIAGVFITLENQIRIGDVVTIEGKTGLVESVQIRILVLRDFDGDVHTFHNGSINSYTNLTKDYAYAMLDLPVAYKEDVQRVLKVLTEIGDELARATEFSTKILAPPEVLGIHKLEATTVTVRMRIRTAPMEHWAVDRELRRRVKERFDRESIALA